MFRIPHMFRDRGMFAPGGGAPFGVANLQADPNCVLAQLPDYGVWGVQDFLPRRNLLTYTEDFSNAAWTLVNVGSSTLPVLTAAYAQSPDGTTTAWRFQAAISGSVSGDYSQLHRGSISSLNRNTSIWVKSNTGSSQTAWFRGGSSSTGSAVTITTSWTQLVDTGFDANGYFTLGLRGTVTGVASLDILIWHPMVCLTSTLDQSYQRVTDWTTEQYAWAAQKQAPWLRRNRFLNTATLSTQTVSSVTANPITVSFKGTGTITFSTAYSGSLVGTGVNDRVTATFTPSAGNLVCTVSGTVTEAQCENASAATPYQPIGASWDATYAALAAAAGFNTGIWQDAGTNPVNTSGQSVYRIADASGKGYTANQATAANRPLWTLDANAKPYLLGDNVNDAMPVTFPASFSSNASVYVTTDAGTTVTDGVTLNGSYAPLVAEKQYARVIFKSGRPTYHEKLIRWLNAKAGL